MATLLNFFLPHRQLLSSSLTRRHLYYPKPHLGLLVLVLTLFTISHTSSVNAAAATPTPAPANPLMHFFACQQKQNKAVTECSATAFSGLNTATPQLTAAECCSLTSYTNCVVERAVDSDGGQCQAALATVKEQMLAALKQNCGTVACSASSLSSFFTMHFLLFTTLSALITAFGLTSSLSA